MKLRSVLFIFITLFTGYRVSAQYVTVNSNCGFTNGSGTNYKPLVCNYYISFIQSSSGSYSITAGQGYSNYWISGFPGNWCFDAGGNLTNHIANGQAKLASDLHKLKSLGFTEIRLVGAGILSDPNHTSPQQYMWPTRETNVTGTINFFNLMDAFLTQVNDSGLRIIWLVGGGANNYGAYKPFLSAMANHYQNSPAITAYDIFNEPQNVLWPSITNDKYNFAKMFTDVNTCLKTNDHNHLTTIGLYGPQDIFGFDPQLMTVDFVSFHFYSGTNNLTQSDNMMDAYYYWCGKTITMPWIIGETSYSATSDPNVSDPRVGSESNQNAYVQHTLQKSVDCNCKGYSWWQYQEMNWGAPYDDHMGLYYCYGTAAYPYVSEQAKYIVGQNTFNTYAPMTQHTSNCNVPSSYYSVLNGNSTSLQISGTVKDNNNVAMANAVVVAKDNNYGMYITFTDASGNFTVKLNTSSAFFTSLSATYPGYNVFTTGNFSSGQTFNLTKENYNNWAKEWANTDNSSYSTSLLNPTTPSLSWNLSAYDKFYKGDFNGDKQQDLLCVKYSPGNPNNDRMVMLTYTNTTVEIGTSPDYNVSTGWSLLWDNQSSSSNGGGIYPYRNNLVVGDFDGNGSDDIMGLGTGFWTTWFTFSPNSNPNLATWNWIDSDYGTVNNSSHPMSYMAPYTGNYVVGDFYGIGKASFVGVSGNWITSFSLVSGVWSWGESNGGNHTGSGIDMLYSYSTKFFTGNFDGSLSGQAEVLGYNSGGMGSLGLFKYVSGSWTTKWHEPGNTSSGLLPYIGNLVIGNFDSDPNDEILGINSSYIVDVNFNSGTSPWAPYWDGGYVGTISDWSIPNNNSGGKYILINTDKNTKQQQLLAINTATTSLTASFYSFRPNPESTWPCSTLRIANGSSTGINIVPEAGSDILVFPNPNDGKFQIQFNQANADLTLNIFDIQGKEVGFTKNETDSGISINLGNVDKGIYFLRGTVKGKAFVKKVVVF